MENDKFLVFSGLLLIITSIILFIKCIVRIDKENYDVDPSEIMLIFVAILDFAIGVISLIKY